MMSRERILLLLFIVIVALLAVTAIKPYDRGTWLMEVAPVLIALPLLVLTYRRFPLTSHRGNRCPAYPVAGAGQADGKLHTMSRSCESITSFFLCRSGVVKLEY